MFAVTVEKYQSSFSPSICSHYLEADHRSIWNQPQGTTASNEEELLPLLPGYQNVKQSNKILSSNCRNFEITRTQGPKKHFTKKNSYGNFASLCRRKFGMTMLLWFFMMWVIYGFSIARLGSGMLALVPVSWNARGLNGCHCQCRGVKGVSLESYLPLVALSPLLRLNTGEIFKKLQLGICRYGLSHIV